MVDVEHADDAADGDEEAEEECCEDAVKNKPVSAFLREACFSYPIFSPRLMFNLSSLGTGSSNTTKSNTMLIAPRE